MHGFDHVLSSNEDSRHRGYAKGQWSGGHAAHKLIV
jgi:hypothetical protein